MARQNGIIRLDSRNTTYIIRINENGILENIHYGRKLRENTSVEALYPKRQAIGTGVSYSESNPDLFLQTACLETSTPGKGDFRSPAAVISRAVSAGSSG